MFPPEESAHRFHFFVGFTHRFTRASRLCGTTSCLFPSPAVNRFLGALLLSDDIVIHRDYTPCYPKNQVMGTGGWVETGATRPRWKNSDTLKE